MKTIELRFGNYIAIEGNTVVVTGIKGTHRVFVKGTGYYTGEIDLNINKVRPIAITEQWLSNLNLKLRYKTDDYTMHQFGDTEFDIIYDFAKLENKFSITFEGNPIAYSEYIHQLQNFHYMLTNIDLHLR